MEAARECLPGVDAVPRCDPGTGVGNSSVLERRTELMSQYMPPITPSITLEMTKGFALHMAKSVFNRVATS